MLRDLPWQVHDTLAMNDTEQPSGHGGSASSEDACRVCRKPIVENQWFCRLPPNGAEKMDGATQRVLLGSPSCALRHFASSRPRTSLLEPSYDGYEHQNSNS